MRFITFFAFATLLATTNARPIVHRRGIILETTSLDGDTPSATTLGVVASATDISTDIGPTDLPTATSDPEVTNSGDLASATATDAPTSVASSTDPTVTDPSNSVDPLSASATPTDTTNATDVSVTATDSFTDTATATASASISFVIPTVPTACVAKLNDPSLTPSSTVSADFSQNTASADLTTTSDNSTVTDTGLSANATSTDTDSLSATATASVSASGSASASTASATASESDSTDLPQPTGALPLVTKRIAQEDLPDVAQAWQDLCLVSGGDIFTEEPCVILAGVNGINALLANADPCDQQDNADAMIDFAKSDGVTNKDELIANAIAYRQHPRNALNIEGIIPSTPYCQKAPRNQELVGVVNDQLPGVNPGIFGGPTFGLVAFGDPSSCPLGTSPNVDTCGCE